MTDSTTPTLIQKRAIDVTPYHHGIWCSIADGAPFVNAIVHRRWSEDGSRIWFGLDSHNGFSAAPNEMVEVVECTPPAPAAMVERWLAKDARRMAAKPVQGPCPHCKGTGQTWQTPKENPCDD